MPGKAKTEEVERERCRKMSTAMTILWNNSEFRERMVQSMKGIPKSEEWKRISSIRNAGQGNGMFGKKHTKETLSLLRKHQKENCLKSRANFQNLSQERLTEIQTLAAKARTEKNTYRLILSKICSRPNPSESKLMELINLACPNEYEYTGNGSFNINGMYPDFVNKDRNKIIELFGEPWHSPGTDKERINKFSLCGYDCIVIWWRELDRKKKEDIIDIIRDFNGGIGSA